ncbi:MAG: diguanylate cyclase, partial [Gammaproteobacteria bacterium]|nr:diguanylate cyclase [Gammaproteobacteria bacterium]
MIKYLALIQTMIGVILLMYAAQPTLKISKTESNRGWWVLFALICFFIVGYLAYIITLLSMPQATIINLIIASVLFGGSIFVVLVIYLSQFTLEKIHRVARQEQYNALHDELTGLPNRKYMLQHLAAKVLMAKANRLTFALISMDIDSFQSINDSLGHVFGDLLLKQLATRLQSRLASDIFLARTGGDDFALVVPDTDPDKIKKLCVDLRNYLREPFEIDGHMISISTCPGVVCFPTHGETTAALMQGADIAMRAAKKQKLLMATYDKNMAGATSKNLALVARLPDAIAQQEFELFYQPLMRNDKQQVFGVEALIRWPQQDQTVFQPGDFIPL